MNSMSNIAVPSRFACLNIDDDEGNANRQGTAKKKQPEKSKKNSNNGTKKTTVTTSKQQVSKKSRSKAKKEVAQWEEWKKKDDELVNDNFEQDLRSALIQSQIDYEQIKTTNDGKSERKSSSESGIKKKKSKTMSLEEFLEDKSEETKSDRPLKVNDDIFKKAVQTAKDEITKEKVERKRKEREENIEEVISLAQCQEKLEKERFKNSQLTKQLEEARNEIALVKARNSTLCSMLSQGEMKDKASVLLELERLTLVKQELTEEVTRLHEQLEQERSKSNTVEENRNFKHKEKQKRKKN